MRGGTSARSTWPVSTTMPPTSCVMRSAPAPMLPTSFSAIIERSLELAAHELANEWIGRVEDRRRGTAMHDLPAIQERDLVDELRERHHVGRYREHGRAGPLLIGGEQV